MVSSWTSVGERFLMARNDRDQEIIDAGENNQA